MPECLAVFVVFAVHVPIWEELLQIEAQSERQGAFVDAMPDQVQVIPVDKAQRLFYGVPDIMRFREQHHFTSVVAG